MGCLLISSLDRLRTGTEEVGGGSSALIRFAGEESITEGSAIHDGKTDPRSYSL